MTGVEICLLCVGAAFIIFGNIFSGRKGNSDYSSSGREIWSDKDEVTIKDRVNIVLADKSEEIINETDEKLCHISNEKIMEFQEYAEQLLDKLNENHNQTVFMYKMLTDKQDEMKEWITDIDRRYTSVKDELNSFTVNVSENPSVNKNISEKNDRKQKNDSVKKTQIKNTEIEVKEKAVVKDDNIIEKSDKKSENNTTKESKVKSANISNKNEKILELYDSGKSIVDVSKSLGIGQGEVKLVVGLYRGKK